MSEKSFAAITVAAAIVCGTFFYPPAPVSRAAPLPKAAAAPVKRPVLAATEAAAAAAAAQPSLQAQAKADRTEPAMPTGRGGRTASIGLAQP